MPRYFFNTADGGRNVDPEGTDLPGHDYARVQAVQFAGMTLAHDPTLAWEGGEFRVEVTDENGALLFTVITFAMDAAKIQ